MKYCRCLKHCADINSLKLHHTFQCRQAEGNTAQVPSCCGSQSSAPATRKQGQILLRGQERIRGQWTPKLQEGKGEITMSEFSEIKKPTSYRKVVTHWTKLPCHEILILGAIQDSPGKGPRQLQLTFKLHLTTKSAPLWLDLDETTSYGHLPA